jgi:hypothetical protein
MSKESRSEGRNHTQQNPQVKFIKLMCELTQLLEFNYQSGLVALPRIGQKGMKKNK